MKYLAVRNRHAFFAAVEGESHLLIHEVRCLAYGRVYAQRLL